MNIKGSLIQSGVKMISLHSPTARGRMKSAVSRTEEDIFPCEDRQRSEGQSVKTGERNKGKHPPHKKKKKYFFKKKKKKKKKKIYNDAETHTGWTCVPTLLMFDHRSTSHAKRELEDHREDVSAEYTRVNPTHNQ